MASLPNVPGLLAAAAVGGAASAAIEPAFEIPRQDAWNNNRNRLLDPQLMARLVAQGGITIDQGRADAHREGLDDGRFDALVYLAQTVPGFAQALDLWRRDRITDAEFQHTLVKAGMDQRYVDQFMAYKTNELIPPPDLAYMVIRDIVPDPYGFDGPSGPNDTAITDMGTLQLDTLAEAARSGWDATRFEALVGRTGLAPAPVTAANAYFRGIASYDEYLTMIKKGDLRPAYANVILNTARQILTAEQWAELQLRGYVDAPTRRNGTDLHGMSHADSDHLYDVLGRGLSLRQAFIGERRGGTLNGDTSQIPEWALYQLERGNLRPEVFNLAWSGRESLPSAFVIRSLLQDGAITEARGEELFLWSGWPADLAHIVATHYAGGTTASADPHVAKAQTQLWTTTHRAYLNHKITDAAATAALTAAGVTAAAVPQVLTLWGEERNLDRKPLSAAQVKKAWVEQVVNPDTGVAWTRDEALAYLIELGYSSVDASTFLEL